MAARAQPVHQDPNQLAAQTQRERRHYSRLCWREPHLSMHRAFVRRLRVVQSQKPKFTCTNSNGRPIWLSQHAGAPVCLCNGTAYQTLFIQRRPKHERFWRLPVWARPRPSPAPVKETFRAGCCTSTTNRAVERLSILCSPASHAVHCSVTK